MQDFPLKKTFVQDFKRKETVLFTIKYEQATIAEYQEYQTLDPTDQRQQVISMIFDQVPYTIGDRVVNILFRKKRKKLLSGVRVEEVVRSVLQNRFRSYESIFTGVKMPGDEKPRRSIFSANIRRMCEVYSIDPKKLFEEYTWEQYFWLYDGIIFAENEKSKEGRTVNDLVTVDVEAVKERARKTREYFEGLEKYKQSKK